MIGNSSQKGLAALTWLLVLLISAGAAGDQRSQDPAPAGAPVAPGPRVRILAEASAKLDLSFSSSEWLTVLEECGEDALRCRVDELGTAGGSRWFFRLVQSGIDGEIYSWSGGLIEQPPGGEAREVWSAQGEAGLAYVGDVALFTRQNATYLIVPIVYDGTGSFHEDQFFQWKDGYWQQVEIRSWWNDLQLAPCRELWKGPFIDFATLWLKMDTWLADDGNANGSGGELEVQFEVRNDRLVAATWELNGLEDPRAENSKPFRCGSKAGRCPTTCPKTQPR